MNGNETEHYEVIIRKIKRTVRFGGAIADREQRFVMLDAEVKTIDIKAIVRAVFFTDGVPEDITAELDRAKPKGETFR